MCGFYTDGRMAPSTPLFEARETSPGTEQRVCHKSIPLGRSGQQRDHSRATIRQVASTTARHHSEAVPGCAVPHQPTRRQASSPAPTVVVVAAKLLRFRCHLLCCHRCAILLTFFFLCFMFFLLLYPSPLLSLYP